MALKFKDAAGVLRTITKLSVRDAGSVTRSIRSLKVKDGATLRTVATFILPLTVSISPSGGVFGAVSSSVGATVTTNAATATPAGGTAPYTYSWVRLSGFGAANTATSAVTTFSEFVQPSIVKTGVFRVTVTDAASQTATATVNATFENYGD